MWQEKVTSNRHKCWNTCRQLTIQLQKTAVLKKSLIRVFQVQRSQCVPNVMGEWSNTLTTATWRQEPTIKQNTKGTHHSTSTHHNTKHIWEFMPNKPMKWMSTHHGKENGSRMGAISIHHISNTATVLVGKALLNDFTTQHPSAKGLSEWSTCTYLRYYRSGIN